MSQAAMDTSNSKSRGQTLELFQKRFLEATLESIAPADTPNNNSRSTLRQLIAKAVSRPAFRAYIRTRGAEMARSIRTKEGMNELLGDGSNYRYKTTAPGQPYREGQSEFWIARQMGYAGDYAHYLFASGSLRTLYDAVGIGLFKQRQIIRRLGIVGDNEEFIDQATQTLLYGTNNKLSSFLNSCKRTLIIHDGNEGPAISLLDGIVTQCLRSALMEFPYVQTAMDAAGRVLSADARFNIAAVN
jgi:hypothetical protein